MPTIPFIATDLQYAALTAAQEFEDLTANPKHGSPEAYLQFVMDGACESYAKRYKVRTVANLELDLAVHKDIATQAEAAKAEAIRIRAEKEAENATLKARVVELEAAPPKLEEAAPLGLKL